MPVECLGACADTTIAPELIVQYGDARRPDEVRERVEP
jgi:hypothetical protein